MNQNDALSKLGIRKLRKKQTKPMEAILAGKDTFVMMPTSGGKSLLYTLPAVMEEGEALTIVVSPLRALQVDQVQQLQRLGIRAELLNSDLARAERRKILDNLSHTELLYLAPEQLSSADLRDALSHCHVSRIAVDEAHVLPQAQHGFRKAYGEIGTFISSLPTRPQVIACTATATPKVRKQILSSLGVPDAAVFTSPVRRKNLFLQTKKAEGRRAINRAVDRALRRWKQSGKRKKRGAVIVYCPTVKGVKSLSRWLKGRGWKVGKYTGKMSQAKRQKAMKKFLSGKIPVMIATNAFGLGINKANVRLVIHAGLPLGLSNYVQEIGRAGRDGKDAACVLLYSAKDYGRNKNILKHGTGKKAARRAIHELDALKKLLRSRKCLWRGIAKHFGQKAKKHCGHCSYCAMKKARNS